MQENKDQLILDYLNSRGVSSEDKKLLIKGLSDFCFYSSALKEIKDDFKVSILGSARIKENNPNYKLAKDMGELIASKGYKVITGAGPGIMQAGNEGAGKRNSVGFNIDLPFEDAANHIVDGSQYLVTCNYFFTRKVMFVRESNAMIAFPGGFGTLDELCEVITLIQTGRAQPMPLILLESENSNFWSEFEKLSQVMLSEKTISESDLTIFKRFTNPQDALDYIESFYKRYHSLEYVDDKLIIRLKEKLPDFLLKQIEDEFSSFIRESGVQYLDTVKGETRLFQKEKLFRLVFKADRTKPDMLYRLILALNS